MRTAEHRRNSIRSYSYPKKHLLNGVTKKKLKRIYQNLDVKRHPVRSLSIITFGLGLLSGLILLYRLRK